MTVVYQYLFSVDSLTVDAHVADMHQTAGCMSHYSITCITVYHCFITYISSRGINVSIMH